LIGTIDQYKLNKIITIIYKCYNTIIEPFEENIRYIRNTYLTFNKKRTVKEINIDTDKDISILSNDEFLKVIQNKDSNIMHEIFQLDDDSFIEAISIDDNSISSSIGDNTVMPINIKKGKFILDEKFVN
jgi:hypothetical protein